MLRPAKLPRGVLLEVWVPTMSTATVGSRVRHDPAVLQLTVDADRALPGLLGLRTTGDFAAVVAATGLLALCPVLLCAMMFRS